MAYRYFYTETDGGTGAPLDAARQPVYDDDNNLIAQWYPTMRLANADAVDGDHVCPEPPNTPGCVFVDAAGFPKKTVVVPLGSKLTINKAITLSGGGYYRLRLDGVGLYYVESKAAIECADVDFVRLNGWCGFFVDNSATLDRCLIAGCQATNNDVPIYVYGQNGVLAATDCVFVGNTKRSSGASVSIGGYASATFTRCSGFLSTYASTFTDSINLQTLTQEQVNAIGFVKPPKVYDASNPGYYTDGAAWTMNDWEGVNLRLLSTSTYATGGTSVTSADEIYDLAGNRRKPGGALGAYEVLSDVDRWFCGLAPLWFRVTRDDDGPDVSVWRNTVEMNYGTRVFVTPKYVFQTWNGSSWSGVAYNTANKTVIANETVRFANAPNNVITGGWTVVEVSSTPRDGFTPVDVFTGNTNVYFSSWRGGPQRTTSVSASASSVCCIDANTAFRSNASSVSKVYVEGYSHVDLGDLSTEVVLGKGASARIAGNVVYKDFSGTSAELFKRITPVAPARLTMKNPNISDS